ncbi:MAG: SlyX family protein [Proteobacteria bacterium]|nr:MAG: SlyX family protein [Pseudomonadota bacterium]
MTKTTPELLAQTEQRLIDFEQKISHQEFEIDELKTALHEQQLVIAALEKSLKTLTERFNEAVGGGQPVGPGNDKPPHY